MADGRKEPKTEAHVRHLKDGTIVSAPQDAASRPRNKRKGFKSADPARFGCSILVLVITALVILLHFLGGK